MRISIIALLITIEALLFVGSYCFGAWGLKTDRELSAVVSELSESLARAQQKERLFKERIDRWLADEPFSIEKFARERLAMIKPGDIVYRIE